MIFKKWKYPNKKFLKKTLLKHFDYQLNRFNQEKEDQIDFDNILIKN